MMQIKTVVINPTSGASSIDEAINLELRRLGKKAFAIQYAHKWREDGKLLFVAHIQYEEDEN